MRDKKLRVCLLEELKKKQVVGFPVEAGKRGALVWTDKGALAVEDRCSHDDGELTGGTVDVQTRQIECPRHGARFDLVTGKALCMPAVTPVAVYPVEVQNGEIWVTVPQEP